MKDFKEFLLRGNLITTAVAFVIGLAFADVIKSLVEGLITPLISAILGSSDFSGLSFTLNNSVFLYGAVFTALLTFVLVAAVLFFLVVKPTNAFMERAKKEPPVDETVKRCPHCISEIPAEATVCAYCTRDVATA